MNRALFRTEERSRCRVLVVLNILHLTFTLLSVCGQMLHMFDVTLTVQSQQVAVNDATSASYVVSFTEPYVRESQQPRTLTHPSQNHGHPSLAFHARPAAGQGAYARRALARLVRTRTPGRSARVSQYDPPARRSMARSSG